MTNDAELLRRYADDASQEAFTELVHRHLDFVYTTALRLGRNAHRAEDITQNVFTDLARKAAKLARRDDLVGWLYLSTHYATTDAIRRDVRREARERAVLMSEHDPAENADWERLDPVFDAVLCELAPADRSAILLRYFKSHSLADVGATLHLSEEAARKRVDRALERMRPLLERRGITSTATALALALANQGVMAAPAGLGATVTSTALGAAAGMGGGGSSGLAYLIFMSSTKTTLSVIGLAAMLATGAAVYEGHEARQAKTALAKLVKGADDRAGERSAEAGGLNSAGSASPLNVTASARALQEAVAVKKLSERARLIAAIVGRVNADKFGALYEVIAGLPLPPAEIRQLNDALFQRWAEVDPKGATDYFSRLGTAEQLAAIGTLTSGWAAYDPAAALAWAQGLPSSLNRYNAMGLALAKLVTVDRDAALTFFGKLDLPASRAVSGELYETWIEIDADSAIKSALNLVESGGLLESALSPLGHKWARNDPAAALKWVTDNPLMLSPLSSRLAMAIVDVASTVDPQRTMEAMMAKSNTDETTNLLRVSAASSWMVYDPESARQWLQSQSIETQSQIVFGVAGPRGNPINPEAWLPLAQGLPASEARTTAFQTLLSRWAAFQPLDSLQYLAQLNDAGLINQITPAVAQGVAKTDPQLAFKLVLDLPENDARERALTKITSTWAGLNPEQASAQISALPESESRTNLLLQTAAVWAQSNPSGASMWAQNLPVEMTGRDSALSALASVLFKKHPDLARQNAEAIHSPQFRQEILSRIAGPASSGAN